MFERYFLLGFISWSWFPGDVRWRVLGVVSWVLCPGFSSPGFRLLGFGFRRIPLDNGQTKGNGIKHGEPLEERLGVKFACDEFWNTWEERQKGISAQKGISV